MHCPTVPYPVLNMKQVKKHDTKCKFLFTTAKQPANINLHMFIITLLIIKSATCCI